MKKFYQQNKEKGYYMDSPFFHMRWKSEPWKMRYLWKIKFTE